MQWDGTANLAELTDLVYAGLFGECSWQVFLDRLATAVPDGKAALHYHDLVSPAAQVPGMSGFSCESISQFISHFAGVNPWLPKTTLVPVGQGVIADNIFPRSQLIKSEFYNDWLKPQTDCETSIGVTVVRAPARTCVLSLCTPCLDIDLNNTAANLLSELSPHLRRAVDFLRKTDVARGQRQAEQGLFDAIGVGVIYVSDARSIRSMNDSAKRIIASGAPLRVTANGRLAFQSQETTDRLEHLTSRHSGEINPQVFMAKGNDIAAYRVTLVRMNSDAFIEFLNGPTVAVIIEPTTAPRDEVAQERLIETFKLTPKEARIASGILSGLSLKEMALADGVSYETVRSHLKSIYAKLQVNSQAALVALLMR